MRHQDKGEPDGRRRRTTIRVLIACSAALTACAGARELAGAYQHAVGSSTGSTVKELLTSKDPKHVLDDLIKRKGDEYARDPTAAIRDAERVKSDFERMQALLEKAVRKTWGDKEVKLPQRKKYVKYGKNYRSRTEVDFERGEITVESLDGADALREATATALQTPDDPSDVDIFSDKPVRTGGRGKPMLSGVVVDDRQRPVRTRADAESYADRVVRTQRRTRTIDVNGAEKKATYVKVKMPPNFQNQLAENYRPTVLKFAEQYDLDPSLVFAIMRTESNFNPYAVSSAPAYGLMQLVPKSGGRDGYRHARGTDGIPTKEFLFVPENNIELGTAYLHVLTYKLLQRIENMEAREYCVISAYNTGPRNVFRSFSKDERSAVAAINDLEPPTVFDHLHQNLPYDETRQYLVRVTGFKKQFRASDDATATATPRAPREQPRPAAAAVPEAAPPPAADAPPLTIPAAVSPEPEPEWQPEARPLLDGVG